MSHLKNFQGIVSGYKNYIFPCPTIEAMAVKRAKICSACSNCDPNHPFKKLLADGETIEEIKGLGCTLCGCLLSVKTRQLFSDCPENRWADKKLSTLN
jgi:hypothetical protein